MRRYGLALLGSHASHLLLLLVLLLWFIASDGEGATAAGGTYAAAICASSIFCGDHVEIKYPFYLSNTTGASNCGYPWLSIICEGGGNRAILRLGNYNYTVLEINHGNHTVTVADPDALDGGGCPRVKHNVTLPPVLTFSSPSNDSITFFFNCDATADVVLRPQPYIRPINCSGFDFEGRPSFVAEQPDVDGRDEREWLGVCKEVVVAPVLKDLLVNEEYYGKLGGDGYGAVLKRGFQMSWDPTAGMCYDCEHSGGRGQCSYGRNNEFFGCLCSDGHVSNTTCGE